MAICNGIKASYSCAIVNYISVCYEKNKFNKREIKSMHLKINAEAEQNKSKQKRYITKENCENKRNRSDKQMKERKNRIREQIENKDKYA